MDLLSFGMKHKKSQNSMLRFLAKICINAAKKKAEQEEERLKKLNIKEIDEKAAKDLLKKMEKEKK